MASSPNAPGAVGAKETVTATDSPGARRPPAGTHTNGHRDVLPGASTSRSSTRYDTGNADGFETSTVAFFDPHERVAHVHDVLGLDAKPGVDARAAHGDANRAK